MKKNAVAVSNMENKEKALEYFSQRYHCSQAVLAAYAKECGIEEEKALKLGACFGSGMRQGEVCGAATGALMVLGLLYGNTKPLDRDLSNKVNDEFLKRFKERNGSYLCNSLLKCDIRTIDGINYAKSNNLFTEFCPKMVYSACEIIDALISELNNK